MIWVLLFILIFGRPTNMALIPMFNKSVKKYVEVEANKKQILENSKAFKKEKKEYQKGEEKFLKHFASNSLNRNTPEQFFEISFKKMSSDQDAFDQQNLEKRLKIQELLKEEEWQKILKAAEKKLKKEKKNNQKALEKLNKVFEKTKNNIVKDIPDPDKQNKILSIVDQLQTDLNQNIKALFKYNYLDNEIFRNINAKESEIQAVVKEVSKIRQNVFESLVDARFKMVEETTEQEWDAVVKSINKLLKLFVKADN